MFEIEYINLIHIFLILLMLYLIAKVFGPLKTYQPSGLRIILFVCNIKCFARDRNTWPKCKNNGT